MADRMVFCLGATKAGTSWLFRALKDHPETHFRSIKELHYFDALDKDRVSDEIARQSRLRAAESERLSQGNGNEFDLLRRIGDRSDWIEVLEKGEDPDAYRAYLNKGANGRLVGDFTPAYGLLSVARLTQMAHLMGRVAFVYLIRDPVQRLWSQIRQVAAMRDEGGQVSRARAESIFERALRGDETEITSRCDYRSAIEKLSQVAPEQMHLAVTEDVTTETGFARLCRALGLVEHPPLAERINEGQTMEMTEQQRARARAWLAPQYDFVARHLGALPSGWDSAMTRV